MEVSLAPFDICEFASELPWQFSWKINFTDTPFERIQYFILKFSILVIFRMFLFYFPTDSLPKESFNSHF